MAGHWRIQGLVEPSFLVLWVMVAVVCGVDSSPASPASGDVLLPFSTSSIESIAGYRITRTTDEDTIEPSIPEESANLENTEDLEEETNPVYLNANSDSITSDERNKDHDLEEEEEIKPKPNNKQQNYFKNFGYNKVNLDSKYLASNESNDDKQKTGGYLTKQSSPSKKDIKSGSDYILKENTSHPAVQNKYMLEKKKAKLDAEADSNRPLNVTKTSQGGIKQNETQEMSDQPMEDGVDVSHNSTDLEDDDLFDSFPQNTTNLVSSSNGTLSADGRTMPAAEGLNILVICGIIVGTVIALGIMAGGGFAVYRHRLWNKPQTLSDKCSNADSSGYIDDSTLRENSEEMYSLDNDSFLNSLEAMTIQNYWTDNVKHTKL